MIPARLVYNCGAMLPDFHRHLTIKDIGGQAVSPGIRLPFISIDANKLCEKPDLPPKACKSCFFLSEIMAYSCYTNGIEFQYCSICVTKAPYERMIFVWMLPVASLLLVLTSMFISVRSKEERDPVSPNFLISVNGVFLFFLLVFLVYYVQDERIITAIPAVFYWFLIVLGAVVGLFSSVRKYIPGYMTSAALLLFTGFIAIFSVGILLIAMALSELLIVACLQFMKLRRSA
ncbi:hypothetical protein ACFOLF_21650 [Paenibacillus sepulcri]|uniref:Uncharacterized protein n=1 Tax=Paenibacillus sepulcri TaxID=359917 RepID=A0ABS7C266_9BACL|nr:hypothetical protein [Paenibacillus sepulcri]